MLHMHSYQMCVYVHSLCSKVIKCIYICSYDRSICMHIFFSVLRPKIVRYPLSKHVNITQHVTFTCSATGYNVNYQWIIGSGSFPGKVSGVNSNILIIQDVRSSDDNTYTCMASNIGGKISSNPARLTVTGMHNCNTIL